MMQGDDKINQQDTPSTEPSPQGSSVQRNLSHYLLKCWSTPGLLLIGSEYCKTVLSQIGGVVILFFLVILLWWAGSSPPPSLLITAAAYRQAIPALSNLMVRTAFFQYDRGHLPGVEKPIAADRIGGHSDIAGENGIRSRLHTWRVEDADADPPIYRPAIWDFKGNQPVFVDDSNDHFSDDIDIRPADLTGRRLRPNHVFYRTDNAGLNTEGYAYAAGVFGDAKARRFIGRHGRQEQLRVGTGYAILEIHNSALQQKHVMTWERWRPVTKDAAQIVFVSPDENPAADPATARSDNYCWVPSKAAITTDAPAVFEAMLKDLRKAGWRF